MEIITIIGFLVMMLLMTCKLIDIKYELIELNSTVREFLQNNDLTEV